MNDKASQICRKYLHAGFDENTNVVIHDIVHEICPQKRIAITMILEIAYRCGYAKSDLADDMSEVTYKKKKKRIRDRLAQMVEL